MSTDRCATAGSSWQPAADRLAQLIFDEGWPLRRAAERWKCSVTTARRSADRYRELGCDAVVDRHSARERPFLQSGM
jgi:hypothetical protein